VKLLQDQLERLKIHMGAAWLFPVPPVIHFVPEQRTCAYCSKQLVVQKTRLGARAATLAIGEFRVHETICVCPGCGTVVPAAQLRELIPPGANFGYDVMVHIGKLLFLQCRGYEEIREDLLSRNISISLSEIGVLAKKFVLSIGMLHRRMQGALNDLMQFHGGYILHLDGTCEGASPHLVSVLDGITEIVLENIKLTSENAQDLIPFLQHIRSSYGDPAAVVSDMGKGIAGAVAEVFPEVPAFICHFHFLKAAGNDLLGAEQELIRGKLRKHKVRAALRNLRKRLEQHIDSRNPHGVAVLAQGVRDDGLQQADSYAHLPLAAAYLLVLWVLDASSTCSGYGFPFDQPYLVLYQRIREAYRRLKDLLPIQLQGNYKDNRCYGWVLAALRSAINDPELAAAALRMEQKVQVFTRLRRAMRITLPEGKQGLTDCGELPVNMHTIRSAVTSFCTALSKQNQKLQYPEYQKLIATITSRGPQLFADPILLHTAAGSILIQPQRTNNLLETFFRKLMRGYRKRNGFSSVEKKLKTMLTDTPLVMNLNNAQYMNLLIGKDASLEQRFAELDIQQLRHLFKEKPIASCACFPFLKNIIRRSNLPEAIVGLLKKTAS